MRTLPIPPAAKADKDSLEMLRAWVVDGDLQIAMSSWVWKEDFAPWGQLLAETIHHLATALESETKRPRKEIAKAIKKSLDHHFSNPRNCFTEILPSRNQIVKFLCPSPNQIVNRKS